MTDSKRRSLKQKIADGEARHQARAKGAALLDRAGETAVATKNRVTDFAKAHPVATVAGAVVVGVLLSGLFRGSPTRRAAAVAGSRASGLARIGTELALALAARAVTAAGEARHASADRLGDLGETLGDTAKRIGRAGSDARQRVTEAVQRHTH